jgi:hypothetical protein
LKAEGLDGGVRGRRQGLRPLYMPAPAAVVHGARALPPVGYGARDPAAGGHGARDPAAGGHGGRSLTPPASTANRSRLP